MDTALFSYHLPSELIAQRPLKKRDHARLMIVHRDTGRLEHRYFYELPEILKPTDVLVLNDTKVFPARIMGADERGRRAEVLLVQKMDAYRWRVMCKPGKRFKLGNIFFFGTKKSGRVESIQEDGLRIVRFNTKVPQRFGEMPLPPYIKEKNPRGRYQTVFAKHRGSIAAPTAGFHFTRELLKKLQDHGIAIEYVTLHVGRGTFIPITASDVEKHRLPAEQFFLSKMVAKRLNAYKAAGRRIIAVGTTATRTLETLTDSAGFIKSGSGMTDLFIHQGMQFKCIEGLITNFHLPKTTLLVLVATFATREKILNAYTVAIKKKYRFYSFGDAMLVL